MYSSSKKLNSIINSFICSSGSMIAIWFSRKLMNYLKVWIKTKIKLFSINLLSKLSNLLHRMIILLKRSIVRAWSDLEITAKQMISKNRPNSNRESCKYLFKLKISLYSVRTTYKSFVYLSPKKMATLHLKMSSKYLEIFNSIMKKSKNYF